MMDGHPFPTQRDASITPHVGEPLDYRALQLRLTDQLQGDRFDFFGGSIILHTRGPFELCFENDVLDVISFSLDCAGDIWAATGEGNVREATLLPGRIHFTPAGTRLYWRYDGQDMQLISIVVRSDRVRALAESMDLSSEDWPAILIENLQTPVADGLARRLREFMLSNERGGSAVAESMATVAIYETISALPGLQGNEFRHPVSLAERGPMRRALDFIDENLDQDITLNDIAAVACKSPFHFARRFKDTMGITPVAYLIERRVERSKELLRRTDLAIATIAEQCGFNSQSHYCRTFRRLTAMTPRDFRRT